MNDVVTSHTNGRMISIDIMMRKKCVSTVISGLFFFTMILPLVIYSFLKPVIVEESDHKQNSEKNC